MLASTFPTLLVDTCALLPAVAGWVQHTATIKATVSCSKQEYFLFLHLIDFSINFSSLSHLFAAALSQRSPHLAAHRAATLMRSVQSFTSNQVKSSQLGHTYSLVFKLSQWRNRRTDFSRAAPAIRVGFDNREPCWLTERT